MARKSRFMGYTKKVYVEQAIRPALPAKSGSSIMSKLQKMKKKVQEADARNRTEEVY